MKSSTIAFSIFEASRPCLPRLLSSAPSLLLALLIAGCASIDDPFIPAPMVKATRSDINTTSQVTEGGIARRDTSFYQTPKPPPPVRTTVGRPPPPPVADAGDTTVATVNLENMPLPQFVNAIFGAILKRNVAIDAQVAQRTEMITFRTGKPQSTSQIFAAAQALLRSYGIAVNDYSGTIRVVAESSQGGSMPEIRRGRASPDIPATLRPVFFLAEMEHVPAMQVSTWLRTLFKEKLVIQDDQQRNALLLSGQSDTVSAAMEAIQMLDQPLMRGRLSARIVPVFWSADEMAKRLVELLQAEGYSVSSQASSTAPILIMPIAPVNSIIVFASNEQSVNHVLRWAKDLDQTPQGRNGNFINYHVRNTDAEELAKTLREVMGMSSTSATATGGATATAAPARANTSKVVVNPAANSLIIQTTTTEFQQWYGLLQELDRPARSALIMATVAEVRLTDNEQFGFQWMLNQFTSHGHLINLGTTNTVSTTAAPGTFRISVANMAGDPRALLTALASSNKIRILSNPSIMARNGQDATIQVGQEVPILTSQVSNANTGSTTGQGLLQTIQYRNTGVILKVKPVIHSGGRIDLDVSQEVSAAQVNETGVNSSPIILSRKVSTKLSVTDGNTLLLGGLMQEQRTAGNSGIPWLKDIPYVGNIFRTSISDNTERTELVILLTPYVVEDDFDARSITEAFRNQYSWASTVKPDSTFGNFPGTNLFSGKPESISKEAPVQPPPSQEVSTPAPVEKVETTPGAPTPPGYRSTPYMLPPDDSNSLRINRPVAPTQQPALAPEISGPEVKPIPAPVVNSAPVTSGKAPEGAKPVVDDALKRELLDSLRR